jgi:squalene-hopene/tetraprenyl-beta-curcumene cyclase
VPFGLETAAIDASTSDVTGRVLWALACAEAAGVLAGHEARLAQVRQGGRAYFERSQARCGSWFGRWSPGYILAANYVAPVLRTLGAKDCAAKLRAFLLAHQNADGGFGENPEADVDDGQAGVGPSTPVHTAYAVVGLVATAPGDSVADDTALGRASGYLMDAARGPTLNAGRPLYTVAFREDYYDAPRMTDAAVLMALRYAARAKELGADAATREWMTGKS